MAGTLDPPEHPQFDANPSTIASDPKITACHISVWFGPIINSDLSPVPGHVGGTGVAGALNRLHDVTEANR